jgi:hypothetical protein
MTGASGTGTFGGGRLEVRYDDEESVVASCAARGGRR